MSLSLRYCYLLFSIEYQPVGRSGHSTVRVGDYLYMWGGGQPGLPSVHDSEEKKASSSVMEVCDLASGRWEQKPTTGTPPLGVYHYAAAVIGREIFFFGGHCGHTGCYHNSLFSFNVDTFNWKELCPHHGPMMKRFCGMVAIQLEEEAYLVVIGGSRTGQQPGTQRDAQYESNISFQYCNEIHYYKLLSGQYN